MEVDTEKISAEISAAEEAARKRTADREKDGGDRGTKDAPACVLAEEDKHVCATHGAKPNSQSERSSKEGEEAGCNHDDTPGKPRCGCCGCILLCFVSNFFGGLQMFLFFWAFIFIFRADVFILEKCFKKLRKCFNFGEQIEKKM